MKRKLFTFFAAVSLLLLVAVCVLWVRSHLLRDYGWAWLPWPADRAGPRHLKFDVDSGGGQLELAWKPWTDADREILRKHNDLAQSAVYHRTFPEVPQRYRQSIPPTTWNALGFKRYSGQTHSNVAFPYWFAALLAGVAPATWLAGRTRRRRRLKAGMCAKCGYDLRATPGRCPECGAAAPGPAVAPPAVPEP